MPENITSVTGWLALMQCHHNDVDRIVALSQQLLSDLSVPGEHAAECVLNLLTADRIFQLRDEDDDDA